MNLTDDDDPLVQLATAMAHIETTAGAAQRQVTRDHPDMKAVATLMPTSRWRSVAMRRPSCTASLASPRCSPSSAAGGVEVVDGDGQAEEAGVALAGGVGLADQLEDHLAEPEEHLAHRRAVGVAVALAPRRRARSRPAPRSCGRGRG